jgi:hypothetical protein
MNKFFYLSLILLTTSVAIQAQTQKGSQLLGGSLSFAAGKGNTTEYGMGAGSITEVINNKMHSFSIGPSYSYFIANNLDLGGALAYYTIKETSTLPTIASEAEKQQGFNYTAYLRKYVLFENKIGFRVGPFISYQYSKSSDDFGNSVVGVEEVKNKLFNAGIGFDFVYFPMRRLGLAANLGTLGYEHITYTRSDNNQLSLQEENHAFGLNLANSNLALSVFYSFGK